MSDSANAWIPWWQAETITRDTDWRKNMEIFVRATRPLLEYGAHDVVLDLGCGPCALAEFIADSVKEIHCLDVSARYLDLCRKKFAGRDNVFFYKLDESRYTDLSIFEDRKFSLVVCSSVIQYYRNIGEVEKIIREVRRIARPRARFLIADIPTRRGSLSDTLGLLKTGFRENYLLESMRVLYRKTMSDYRKRRSATGLLFFSISDLDRLIDRLDLSARILSTPLTVNANRRHLLVQF